MAKNDGGPAFGVGHYDQNGMSLRDWLAGQALAGILQMPDAFERSYANMAEHSYAAADAMLAEREKRDGAPEGETR